MADDKKDTMIDKEDIEKRGYVDREQHEEQEQDSGINDNDDED